MIDQCEGNQGNQGSHNPLISSCMSTEMGNPVFPGFPSFHNGAHIQAAELWPMETHDERR